MKRLDRLDAIVTLLRARGGLSMGAVAEELGVSVRTIRRDVDVLRARGVDVIGDRGQGGGIRLSRRAAMRPVELDEDEVVGLVLSVELARRMPTLPFATAAGPGLDKVIAALPDDRRGALRALTRRIQVGRPVHPTTAATAGQVGPELLVAFERAFTGRHLLAFTYRGADGGESSRRVEPHGLLLRTPIWYVLSHDVDRDAPRVFRMDRMNDAAVLEATFTPRDGLVTGMGRAMGATPRPHP